MTSLSLPQENDLLLRMAAGSEDAFTRLYQHYTPSVNQFFLRYLRVPELVSDLTQDVFIKIWNQRSELPQLKSFRAFLFILARNHALNTLRNASRHDAVIGEIGRHYQQQIDTDDALTKDYLAFLQTSMEALPPRSREVFRLCREQGLSYEEVAKLLGISRNSVKNHMVYSMKALKLAVEKDLGISFALFLAIVAQR